MINMPSTQGLFEWLTTEAQWIFLIGFLIGLSIFAFRRAWIAASLFLIGAIFMGMFIVAPETILDIAEALANQLSIN